MPRPEYCPKIMTEIDPGHRLYLRTGFQFVQIVTEKFPHRQHRKIDTAVAQMPNRVERARIDIQQEKSFGVPVLKPFDAKNPVIANLVENPFRKSKDFIPTQVNRIRRYLAETGNPEIREILPDATMRNHCPDIAISIAEPVAIENPAVTT